MSFKIVNDFPPEIPGETGAPFISLYQPTHRHRPENKQDVIRFKNLIKRLESSPGDPYPKKEREQLPAPFYSLAKDVPFWNKTLDGLVILATKDRGVLYGLQRTVKELAVVADSFHVKPLIRIFQSSVHHNMAQGHHGRKRAPEAGRP